MGAFSIYNMMIFAEKQGRTLACLVTDDVYMLAISREKSLKKES
tara:strand:- start:668 stop:799 length:132 start_codon:yes stop_codon:yes gene_type:complete